MMCAVAFAAVSHIPHIRMCLFMVLGEGVYRSDAALFQGSAKVKLARDCMLHVDDHLRMVAGGHVTRITDQSLRDSVAYFEVVARFSHRVASTRTVQQHEVVLTVVMTTRFE